MNHRETILVPCARRSVWADRAAAGGIVLLCFALLWRFQGYGLVGTDTFPLLDSSQVSSFKDFVGLWTSGLLPEYFPGGFYRPLVRSTIALDAFLWGQWAPGFHGTDVAVFGLACWALYRLAAVLSDGNRVAAASSLMLFGLHPVVVEVLPVPARRGEVLVCVFGALAIVRAVRGVDTGKTRWLAALWTLLALLSKESAIALLPVIGIVLLLDSRRGGSERLRFLASGFLPHLSAALVYLLLRTTVLHGTGGYESVGLLEGPSRVGRAIYWIARDVVLPEPPMRSAAGYALLAVGGLGAGISWALARRESLSLSLSLSLGGRTTASKAALVGLVWGLSFSAVAGFSDGVYPWYGIVPLVGYSLAWGTGFSALVNCARTGRSFHLAAASTALFGAGALAAWGALFSPVFYPYTEWETATETSRAFFEQLESRIGRVQGDRTIALPDIPYYVNPVAGRPGVRGAFSVEPYTAIAWVHLNMPGISLRLIGGREESPPQIAEGRTVQRAFVRRILSGFQGPLEVD